jgi:hypothetical protein
MTAHRVKGGCALALALLALVGLASLAPAEGTPLALGAW